MKPQDRIVVRYIPHDCKVSIMVKQFDNSVHEYLPEHSPEQFAVSDKKPKEVTTPSPKAIKPLEVNVVPPTAIEILKQESEANEFVERVKNLPENNVPLKSEQEIIEETVKPFIKELYTDRLTELKAIGWSKLNGEQRKEYKKLNV